MKFFYTLLFLFPLAVSAQDCSLKDVKDPLNQDTRLSTGFKKMGGGNDQFMLSMETDKREIDFFFVLQDSKICFDEYSRVMVIFEGGKFKTNYKGGGAENCRGYFHLIFKNQANQPATLKNLAEKKIQTLKFTTQDRKTKEIHLSGAEQEQIQQMARCIIDASDGLLNDTWKPKQ